MKPIAIFRHAKFEGPGHLALFLNQHCIPWKMIHIDEGEAVPMDASAFNGIVFMGGPMSVNDDLPWIPSVLALILDAYEKDIPLLGHCLGGQLISKALGGVVTRNPVKEIGWGRVDVADNDAARHWFGDTRHFDAFHWHGETFALPQGAVPLLSSAHCTNQAYAIGKHVAMQCHIEMVGHMIEDWCEVGAEEIAAASDSPGVQSAILMHEQAHDKLPPLHCVADHLYRQWIQGIAPRSS